MQPSSTSGLLLLLIGVTVLAGILTGNWSRWLSYLFDPTHPPLAPATSSAPILGPPAPPLAGERRTS
jgi:hypothetical protein